MRDPNKLTRIIDQETQSMSDRDRTLVRKGAAITLLVVKEEWRNVYGWLDNSEPDLIASTPTVRK